MSFPKARRIVHAPAGRFLVTEEGGVVRARGIRYGRVRRFEPPIAVRPAPETLDVTAPGPACPQLPSRLDQLMGGVLTGLDTSEDCLVLSVAAPAGAAELPVMVWFHGGAYVSGSGEAEKYDPTRLVVEGRVVVINVSYRLGIFGYMTPEGVGDAENLGLQDQTMALQWVAQNVAAFGGDPGNVTLFGQSAGGDSVLSLMLTTQTQGLFARAIIQSAPLGFRAGRAAMHKAARAAVSVALGEDPRHVSTEEVLDAQAAALQVGRRYGPRGSMPFGNVLGAAHLPAEDEQERCISRVAPGIELMLTYAQDDALPFVLLAPRAQRLARLGRVGNLLQHLASRVVTRRIFAEPAAQLAAAWEHAGGTTARYVITWRPAVTAYGAVHCIELPLLFGSPGAWRDAAMLDHDPTQIDDQVARAFRAAWTDFAHGRGFPSPTSTLARAT